MNEQELERLVVRLIGDGSSFNKMLAQAESASNSAAASVGAAASRIEGISSGLSSFGSSAIGVLGGLGAAMGVAGIASSAIQLAAGAETMEVQFGVMLRSADAAKTMVQDLITFAAETPLQLPGVQQGAQTLLQFGFTADQVIPTLRMLGDAAGGNDEKMNAMATAFARIQSMGKATGREIMMMIHSGFNPLMEISRSTGRSMHQLYKDMEAGSLSANDITNALRRATGPGGQFEGMMLRMSRTVGGLFSTMKDDLNGLLRALGKEIIEALSLPEIIRSISSVAQMTTGWLQSMSPEVKRVGAAIMVAIAIVVALGIAFAVAGAIFNTAFGGIGIVLGLVVTGSVALLAWLASFQEVRDGAVKTWQVIKMVIGKVVDWATPTVSGWMSSIGAGWEWLKGKASDAWDWTKTKVMAFFEWSKPIVAAGIGYLAASWDITKRAASVTWNFISDAAVAAWTVIKSYAGQAWSFITEMWSSILGDSTVTWDSIKDQIVESFIRAEFALDNFGSVAQYVWTGAQLGFVRFAGEIGHFFTGTIPAVLTWFSRNWQEVFFTAFSYSNSVSANLGRNLVSMFRNLPGLIAGTTRWDQIWIPLTRGAINAVQTLPQIPQRLAGALEERLRRDFEQQGGALAEAYGAFRERRLAEIASFSFGLDPATVAAAVTTAGNAGAQVGNNFAGAAGKEMHKFDAAAQYSAEALSRIAAQADKLENPTHAQAGGTANAGRSMEAVAAGSAAANAATNQQSNRMEQLLTQIANNTGQIASNPPAEIQEATI